MTVNYRGLTNVGFVIVLFVIYFGTEWRPSIYGTCLLVGLFVAAQAAVDAAIKAGIAQRNDIE